MKRSILIFSLVVVVLVALGSFFYSLENVKPVEAELAKYPEMSPFLVGRTGFRGIRFNLDSNYYSFAFPINFDTAEIYFGAVDASATKEGWRLVGSEPQGRVYTRKKDIPVGATQFEKVTLRYDSEKKEVTIIREDVETQ